MINMTRRNFAIWFAIFTLLQWPCLSVGFYSFIDIIFSMVFMAVFYSNICGIAYIGLSIYYNIPQIWNFLFNGQQWLNQYSHEIGYPGFSFDDVFWSRNVLPLALAIVIAIHLYLCYRRCKTIGIKAWWILVPLYNPFVLLYRKSNKQ